MPRIGVQDLGPDPGHSLLEQCPDAGAWRVDGRKRKNGETQKRKNGGMKGERGSFRLWDQLSVWDRLVFVGPAFQPVF